MSWESSLLAWKVKEAPRKTDTFSNFTNESEQVKHCPRQPELNPQQELEVTNSPQPTTLLEQPRSFVSKRDLEIFALESRKPISQVFVPEDSVGLFTLGRQALDNSL